MSPRLPLLLAVFVLLIAPGARAIVVVPALDFRFANGGNHVNLGATFNSRSGRSHMLLDIRLKTPPTPDGSRDTDYGDPNTGFLNVINGEVFFGRLLEFDTVKTTAGYVQEVGREHVGANTVKVTTLTRTLSDIDQNEFFMVEAGVITSTVGLGPAFGRMVHVGVGVRWVETYAKRVEDEDWGYYWTASIHALSPGLIVPVDYVPDPALPDLSIPVGIQGNYDIGVGRGFMIGLKAGYMPGYEYFMSFDFRWPLHW